MNKGWIAWIILIVVAVVIVYFYTGFKFISLTPKTTLTTSTPTTTVASNSANSTSTVTQRYLVGCSSLFLYGGISHSTVNATCQWQGGTLGIWVLSGKAYNTTLSIVGGDGKTYIKGPFAYNNVTFFANVTLPAQNYTVSMAVGGEAGTGTNPFVKLNTTTTAPSTAYTYILNANFSNGKYTGWNTSGSGFGSGPLNLSYANSNTVNCYYGAPWSNYPGTYFATTYTCGTSVSPGNLTSNPFRVNPEAPFLNFRLVSPDDSGIYIEVFQVGGNATVIGRFNTLNISLGPNVSTTFANVSLPLTTLANRIVRIKVVSDTVQQQRYIAIGEFAMANLPKTDSWVASQVNVTR